MLPLVTSLCFTHPPHSQSRSPAHSNKEGITPDMNTRRQAPGQVGGWPAFSVYFPFNKVLGCVSPSPCQSQVSRPSVSIASVQLSIAHRGQPGMEQFTTLLRPSHRMMSHFYLRGTWKGAVAQ